MPLSVRLTLISQKLYPRYTHVSIQLEKTFPRHVYLDAESVLCKSERNGYSCMTWRQSELRVVISLRNESPAVGLTLQIDICR